MYIVKLSKRAEKQEFLLLLLYQVNNIYINLDTRDIFLAHRKPRMESLWSSSDDDVWFLRRKFSITQAWSNHNETLKT